MSLTHKGTTTAALILLTCCCVLVLYTCWRARDVLPKMEINAQFIFSSHTSGDQADYMKMGIPAWKTQNTLKQDRGGKFRSLVSEKVAARDQELIELVREAIYMPTMEGPIKTIDPLNITPLVETVQSLLNGKREGKFLEYRAGDGEARSTTLYLERVLGWEGLLVEPDLYYYTQIIGKNRQCSVLNACLSTFDYPTEGSLNEFNKTNSEVSKKDGWSPCIPLETILLASNLPKLDYLSLKSSEIEFSILKGAPLNVLDISVISVLKCSPENMWTDVPVYMKGAGYDLHKSVPGSSLTSSQPCQHLVFVKN